MHYVIPTAAERLAHDLVTALRPDRRLPEDDLMQAALQVVRDDVVRRSQQPARAAAVIFRREESSE